MTLGAGLLVLAVFMVVLGGNWFWEKYDSFDIRFRSVKDLNTGRPVKYAGLDVGRVEAIVLDPKDPRFIRVRIGVHRDFPLYKGTVARIAQKGLVGDYYVLLEIRGEPGERLAPLSDIPAVSTMLAGRSVSGHSDLIDVFEAVGKVKRGVLDADALSDLEENACPGCGSCSGM